MGNTLQKQNRPSKRDALRLVIGGLGKHFATTNTFVIDGVTFTVGDLTKLFQSLVDSLDATSAAKAAFAKQVQDLKDETAKVSPVLLALKAILLAQFGKNAAALGDFGLKPRKRSQPSVATKGAAAEKAKATKAARHELGPKQRVQTEAPPPNTAPAKV